MERLNVVSGAATSIRVYSPLSSLSLSDIVFPRLRRVRGSLAPLTTSGPLGGWRPVDRTLASEVSCKLLKFVFDA